MKNGNVKLGWRFQSWNLSQQKKVPLIPIIVAKFIEPIVGIIVQHVKLATIPLRYRCIICYGANHWFGDCLRKAKIQNMFKMKPPNSNT